MSRANWRLPFELLLHWGVRDGTTSFPGLLHFTFHPPLRILSVKQGGIKYYFLSLWYDSIGDWNTDSTGHRQTLEPLENGPIIVLFLVINCEQGKNWVCSVSWHSKSQNCAHVTPNVKIGLTGLFWNRLWEGY